LDDIIGLFHYIGALNFIIFFEENSWIVATFNHFAMSGYMNDIKRVGACDFYPDKLRNMYGYVYAYAIIDQRPWITFREDLVFGTDEYVLSEIRAHQNASAEALYSLMEFDQEGNVDLLWEILSNREADLSLNTIFFRNDLSYRRFINTYDENGYCIIVPIPARTSFILVLMTPFDIFSWISMSLVVVVCAIIWKVSRREDSNTNSHWYFMFGVVAFLLNQSIPFRDNRRLQVALMQVCILMTFLMGNVYQSLIISSITSSESGERFKTVDELLSSEMKIIVYPAFTGFMESFDQFLPFAKDRFVIGMEAPDLAKLAKENYAFVASCNMIQSDMNVMVDSEMAQYFYLLQDIVLPFYEMFILADRSPFHENLQKYYDLFFEAGLRMYWKGLVKYNDEGKTKREVQYFENEDYYLHLDDLQGCFIILSIGSCLSFLIFVLELLSQIRWKNITKFTGWKRNRNKIATQRAKKTKTKLDVSSVVFLP
jgi:hypothetical protein